MKRPASSGEGIERAVAALQAGRLEDAERQLRLLQRRSPDDVRLMHLLGSLALQRSRPVEAVAQFERAVAAVPAEPGFHGLLGNAWRAADRPDKAQDAYRTVLAIDPHSVPAMINLGNLALEQGRLDEAEAYYRRAERLEPVHPDVQNGLGQLALGRVPPDGAASDTGSARDRALDLAAGHFAAALRSAPDHPAALAGQGKTEAARGALDRAVAVLDRALRLAPAQAETAVALGKAALRAGRPGQALAALDHALNVLPPWPGGQAARQYAQCYRSFAAAAAGDRALYRALADPAALVEVTALCAGDAAAGLNAALAAEILDRTPLTWEPQATTTSAGRQSGDLSEGGGAALAAFRKQLSEAIDRRIAALPRRDGHPFLGYRPKRYRLSLWATVLDEGGHQRPHIHPQGWMSGVYYVQVPALAADAVPDAGRLEIGRPEAALALALPAEPLLHLVEAVPGRLVVFPSYLFHRTIPFRAADGQPRISLAFDILPER